MVLSVFARKAPKPDLSAIINRHPAGLNRAVQSTLTDVMSPVPFVGVIGYEFTQYSLRYAVMMMDNNGSENYQFTVTAPSAQAYYHRSKEMSIAEKAHALMTVMQSVDTDRMRDHGTHFKRLETACFNPPSPRQVMRDVTGVRQMPQGNKVVAHVGLSYPDNQNWQEPPTLRLLAMEWVNGWHRYLIDCSGIFPQFIISKDSNPDVDRFLMTQTQAKWAVKYLRDYSKKSDQQLATLLAAQNLPPVLEVFADMSPLISVPAP